MVAEWKKKVAEWRYRGLIRTYNRHMVGWASTKVHIWDQLFPSAAAVKIFGLGARRWSAGSTFFLFFLSHLLLSDAPVYWNGKRFLVYNQQKHTTIQLSLEEMPIPWIWDPEVFWYWYRLSKSKHPSAFISPLACQFLPVCLPGPRINLPGIRLISGPQFYICL